MSLTEAQLRAINTIDNNMQIIACAGSGKTRVVAERTVKILESKKSEGITPENIVAFTFTDKAAAELRGRITRVYREKFGHVQGLGGMYIGTIHGFCLDILQRYLFRYLKYTVLADDVRPRMFVDRYFRKSGMSLLNLRRWINSDLYVAILGIIRESVVDGAILSECPVSEAHRSYVHLLDEHAYFDFAEILARAVAELKDNPGLRGEIALRIKYLVVDEYQDINPIQELLIRTISHLGANLCVVGDDDQNIYQWRGTDVQNIVQFADRYPDVIRRPLLENFRSTDAIVELAAHIVEVNHNRLPKEMKSGSWRAFERGDILALSFENPEQEADWIAEKILSMRGTAYEEEDKKRGLSWSDMAILLRSVRRCAAPIVDALRQRGVPYVVTGMTGLFDTAEIQAAVGIFQFMTEEIDRDHFSSLWLNANMGLSSEQLGRGADLLVDRRQFDPRERFSFYNLQRTYLDFLETIELREENIPDKRGELVYYNLGKFSQVISDYEEIHFKSRPDEKYPSFVEFIRRQAPGYYPEGGQDVAYAVPDAVRIMTVHQAKGTEFPVVFIPCLQKNRFPSRKQPNRVWNYVPREAIHGVERYDSTQEDERRLFYVALTRSEKYLFCSWAPDPNNRLYRQPSPLFGEMTGQEKTLTRDPEQDAIERMEPEPRRPLVNVELSFSELKYFFECPYQFKLRFLYGFNPPLHEAIGYGQSLHNALAEVHRRTLRGARAEDLDIDSLLNTHLHVPYAYPKLEGELRNAARSSLTRYLRDYGPDLDKLEHVEEDVQLTLEEGVVVNGRIDLIKRSDTGEVIVVDFKSVRRAQMEDVTRLQLHVYALGYEQRFGRRADLVEVHNLDEGGSIREMVDDEMIHETTKAVSITGKKLLENQLDRLPSWCGTCERCDLVAICRTHAMSSQN